MASVRNELGEKQEALQLYDRALKIREATYGPQHSSVAQTLFNIANLRRQTGDTQEAKALYSRCEQVFATMLGTDHSYTVMARNGVAACD